MTSFGFSGWKLRILAVDRLAACRFFGVLEGVGSIVTGSMFGSASACREFDGPATSESEDCAPAPGALRALPKSCCRCFRGVLCNPDRLTGDAGDEGGDESCVGARANRARFTVAGGVVAPLGRECRLALGDLSPLNEE